MKERLSFFNKKPDLCGNLVIKSGSVSACSLFLARALNKESGPVLWVTSDKELVGERTRELASLSILPVQSLPSYEHFGFLPFVPDAVTAALRIGALNSLQEGRPGFCVCAPSILMERFVSGQEIRNNSELVMEGEEIERDSLLKWLMETGYERNVRVLRPGHFSVRGEVVDIFSPGFSLPIRLLFFDDLVEEIRLFDPETQRTEKRIQEAVLLPAAESIFSDSLIERAKKEIVAKAGENGWSGSQVTQILNGLENRRQTEGSLALLPFLYGQPWSIFDFLPSNAIILIESSLGVATALIESARRMEESYEVQREKGRILAAPDSFWLDPCRIWDGIARLRRVFLNPSPVISGGSDIHPDIVDSTAEEIDLCAKVIDHGSFASGTGSGSELLGPFFKKLSGWLQDGTRVFMSSDSRSGMERISAILDHYGYEYQTIKRLEDVSSTNGKGRALFLVPGYFQEPFHLVETGNVFVTEQALFRTPAVARQKHRGRSKDRKQVSLSEMSEGDFVVHRDKGIGRYLGLVRMKVAGVDGEFIHLEYLGGDKLYVPVDRLGLLQKYVGLEGREPKLDRLGGRSWQTRKARVKKAIKEVAHELVELYALRKIKKGLAFNEPDEMYRQFEAAFPHDETSDQLQAVRDILEDLQADYPMDRLLCGDVGFGKTEVAMRAAFLAVESGYQVAVLVPTTLLAEQHERTFRERFASFPVTVAGLSRMKSRVEQREILARLKQHEIDILIGTHRLLQNDVVFKRLGLIVIDEEHRFGVKHKEKLKFLARDINCLSLTATPIPRTLQLSLLGIRDLSILEIPPRGRIAIKTFLAEYDDAIVKEAIERELQRGGQVFFVHNRVKGIYRIAEHLGRLVPNARIDVAHGQMEPAELEKKMIRFVRGELDCLVCTTIIESGLDIPSANTLIINRADRLGIADLYQLRGRVGRSSRQAYAYLFVPSLEAMSRDASLRIKAIMETSDLGAGMNLAMHDLKIRGAGNLLGVAQAGQISEVGYDLYLDLLKEAIEDIKGDIRADRYDPEVNIGMPAFVPEEYLPDISERLGLYRWFSQIEDEGDKNEVMKELEDRFGMVPKEVENLLDVMIVKSLLRELNCVRLDGSEENGPMITLTFAPDGPKGVSQLIRLIQTDGRLKLLPGDRVLARLDSNRAASVGFMKETMRLLKELFKLTN